jgi:hypothetical protein
LHYSEEVTKRALITCLTGLMLALFACSVAEANNFKRAPADVASLRMFDLGVIHYPQSNRLAPFTTNHKFRASLKLGRKDHTARLGLSHTPAYPGFEYLTKKPQLSNSGLYIYAQDHPKNKEGGALFLRAFGTSSRGKISFINKANLLKTYRSSAQITRDGRQVNVHFDIARGGFIKIKPNLSVHSEVDRGDTLEQSLPDDLQPEDPQPEADQEHDLEEELPVELNVKRADSPVFIGAKAIPLKSEARRLILQDRHGYTSSDFNGDGVADLFIASGGFGGGISKPKWAGIPSDELFYFSNGRFEEQTGLLDKGTCRGRETSSPDVNGDGRADIFIGCEGARPVLYTNGNWQRKTLPVRGHSYRWANIDKSPGLELLVFKGKRMHVYARGTRKRYSVRLRGAISGAPAIGELNKRGKATIIVPSKKGSTVIVGRKARSIKKLGLPEESRGASIVDVNNDGKRDIYLSPQGLYINQGKRFKKAKAPQTKGKFVILNWADLNNDGRRDLLATKAKREFASSMKTKKYYNNYPKRRWLEIDASDYLGARITVKTSNKRLVGWVGESEGSRWSDTHRRVYFGLGKAKRAEVTVQTQTKRHRFVTKTNRIVRVP